METRLPMIFPASEAPIHIIDLIRKKRDRGTLTEAEIRSILEAAVKPPEEGGIGSAFRALGRRFRGVDLELERDPAPARPTPFK